VDPDIPARRGGPKTSEILAGYTSSGISIKAGTFVPIRLPDFPSNETINEIQDPKTVLHKSLIVKSGYRTNVFERPHE
jgi:hypothetical protein